MDGASVSEASSTAPPRAAAAAGGMLASGSEIGGRYAIGRFLGRDLYGEAYAASDRSTGRRVTFRLLGPWAANAALWERLSREVQKARHVAHKNVLAPLDLATDGTAAYLVTERIEGPPLADLIARKMAEGRPFSLKGAYNAIAHVANGLAAAGASVPHGALTSRAILVNRAGRVKIDDFGLGRVVSRMPAAQLASFGALLRSIAPEARADPDAVTPRSDVHSLGCLVWELVTGRPLPQAFQPPSALVPGLPQALDALCARALAGEPGARFANALELKDALAKIADSASISAQRPAVSPSGAPALPPPAASSAPRPAAPAPARPAAPPPFREPTPAPAMRPPALPSRTPTPPVPLRPSLAAAAPSSDDLSERWLVQKNKLDHGPFTMTEVLRQIDKGEILPEHLLIDNDTGKRTRVGDHPLTAEPAAEAARRREQDRMVQAEIKEAKAEKRRGFTWVLVAGGALAVAALGTWGYIKRREGPKHKSQAAIATLDPTVANLNVTFSFHPSARHHGHGGGSGGSGAWTDDVTNLGDVTQGGGDEQLDESQIQETMTSNFGGIRGCIIEERQRNSSLHDILIEFKVKGSGRVFQSRVNGQTSGPFYSCIDARMKQIQFPAYNGPTTVGSFSASIR